MSITFNCPNTNSREEFPDAYLGSEFRCKHCGETHVLEKQIDLEESGKFDFYCPMANDVLHLSVKMKGAKFKCALCGHMHLAEANTGSSVSSSVLTSIQDVDFDGTPNFERKRNRKTGTLRKPVGGQRKGTIRKSRGPGSETALQPVYTTRRKKKKPAFENDEPASSQEPAVEKGDYQEEPIAPPKKGNYTGLVLVLFVIFCGIGGWLYFESNTKKTYVQGVWDNFNLAGESYYEKEDLETAFRKISLAFEESKVHRDLFFTPDLLQIENRYNFISACRDHLKKAKKVFKDYELNVYSSSEYQDGIKDILFLKNTITGSDKQIKPLLSIMSGYEDALKEKRNNQFSNEIKQKIAAIDLGYKDGAILVGLESLKKLLKLVNAYEGSAPKELLDLLEDRISFFDKKTKLLNKGREIKDMISQSEASIDRSLLSLKKLQDSLLIEDVPIESIFNKWLRELLSKKLSFKAKKIYDQLGVLGVDETRKQLLAFYSSLSIDQSMAKSHTIEYLSRVLIKKDQKINWAVSNDKDLKSFAQYLKSQWGVLLKMKLSVNEENLFFEWKNENHFVQGGFVNKGGKEWALINFDGLMVEYEAKHFKENLSFIEAPLCIQHFWGLRNQLLLKAPNVIFSKTWRLPESLEKMPFLVACDGPFKSGAELFLQDDIYKIKIDPVNVELKKQRHKSFLSHRELFLGEIQKAEDVSPMVKNHIKDLMESVIEGVDDKDKVFDGAFARILLRDPYLHSLIPVNLRNSFRDLRESFDAGLISFDRWLEGDSSNGSYFKIRRNNFNEVFLIAYNADKVETTFAAKPYFSELSTDSNRANLFSYGSVFKGKFDSYPFRDEAYRLETYHSVAGKILEADLKGRLFRWNKKDWKRSSDMLLRPVGEVWGDSDWVNPPHVYKLNQHQEQEMLVLPHGNIQLFDASRTKKGPAKVLMKEDWIRSTAGTLKTPGEFFLFYKGFIKRNESSSDFNLPRLPGSKMQNGAIDLPLMKSLERKMAGKLLLNDLAIARLYKKLLSQKNKSSYILKVPDGFGGDNGLAVFWAEKNSKGLCLYSLDSFFPRRIEGEIASSLKTLYQSFDPRRVTTFDMNRISIDDRKVSHYVDYKVFVDPVQEGRQKELNQALSEGEMFLSQKVISKNWKKDGLGSLYKKSQSYELMGRYSAAAASLVNAAQILEKEHLDLFIKTSLRAFFNYLKVGNKESDKTFGSFIRNLSRMSNDPDWIQILRPYRFQVAKIYASIDNPMKAFDFVKTDLKKNESVLRNNEIEDLLIMMGSLAKNHNEKEKEDVRNFLKSQIENKHNIPFLNLNKSQSLFAMAMQFYAADKSWPYVYDKLLDNNGAKWNISSQYKMLENESKDWSYIKGSPESYERALKELLMPGIVERKSKPSQAQWALISKLSNSLNQLNKKMIDQIGNSSANFKAKKYSMLVAIQEGNIETFKSLMQECIESSEEATLRDAIALAAPAIGSLSLKPILNAYVETELTKKELMSTLWAILRTGSKGSAKILSNLIRKRFTEDLKVINELNRLEKTILKGM